VIRSILALLLCATTVAAASKLPRPSPNLPIHLTPGQITPSQFKGKAVIVALIMTACPHCQETVQYLSGVQKEYGPRGLQVLAAAFNEDAIQQVPGFVQQFKPAFPLGYLSRPEVLQYLGQASMEEIWVPVLVFIDRKGIIRHQHLGDDPFFNEGDKNIRAYIAELLK